MPFYNNIDRISAACCLPVKAVVKFIDAIRITVIANLEKYIVILDDTTKYRDMYYVEWAEKTAAHDMVKKFLSGIPNRHCGMGLSIALQDENRF